MGIVFINNVRMHRQLEVSNELEVYMYSLQDSTLQNISLNTIHLVILQSLHAIQDVDQHHILVGNPNIYKRKYRHGILWTYLCRKAFKQFTISGTSEPKDRKIICTSEKEQLAQNLQRFGTQ